MPDGQSTKENQDIGRLKNIQVTAILFISVDVFTQPNHSNHNFIMSVSHWQSRQLALYLRAVQMYIRAAQICISQSRSNLSRGRTQKFEK